MTAGGAAAFAVEAGAEPGCGRPPGIRRVRWRGSAPVRITAVADAAAVPATVAVLVWPGAESGSRFMFWRSRPR